MKLCAEELKKNSNKPQTIIFYAEI